MGVMELIELTKQEYRKLSSIHSEMIWMLYFWKINNLEDIIKEKETIINSNYDPSSLSLIFTKKLCVNDLYILRGKNLISNEIEDIIKIEFDLFKKEMKNIEYSEFLLNQVKEKKNEI